MEANWFYELEGQQRGPLTEEDLKELRKSDAISDASLVWKEGMPEWATYSSVFPAEPTAPAEQASATPEGGPPPVPEQQGQTSTFPPVVTYREPFVPREAKLRDDSAPRLWSSLGRGWKLLFSDFWPHLGYSLLTGIIAGVAMQLAIPILFLLFPIVGGCYFAFLLKSRGKTTELSDIFEGFKRRFGDLAVINLATMVPAFVFIAVVLGLMFGGCYYFTESGPNDIEEVAVGLVIFGGCFLFLGILGFCSMVGTFATMLCLDCEIGAGEALKLSMAGCFRHFFRILMFSIGVILLSYLGLIVVYIGALITSPWGMMATVYIYEDLFGDGGTGARASA